MIKEKEKITKYNYKKPIGKIVMEYLRTIGISIFVAVIFTTCLALHARYEMIKNIYSSAETQRAIDKKIAIQLINSNKNLLDDLATKKYSVCMQIGKVYETAGEYKSAQTAYESAVEKSKMTEYAAHYALVRVLIAQEKFDEASKILNDITDYSNKKLIKFKTRSYIDMGDKYYSIGKFISAAKSYEKAEFYYDKFIKKDKVVADSIRNRIINSYSLSADEMVKRGYNSDAIRFLKKVENYSPNDLRVKYKIGIVLADADPEKAVEYLEPLLDKIPQEIDYGVYCTALMKAANIADLEGRHPQAKYYRYKIHSIDLFIKRKVIYKNDINVVLNSFIVRKLFFWYPLKVEYTFGNNSNEDIKYITGDFVLMKGDKILEVITMPVANKDNPLNIENDEPNKVVVKFKKKIFTRKELLNYSVKVYLYKDSKFKTLVDNRKVPQKTFKAENK